MAPTRSPRKDWEILPEGVSWKNLPLAVFSAMSSEIEQRFGPPTHYDLDSNGTGPFDLLCLRFACGLEVALWRFKWRSGCEPIDLQREPAWFEINANANDLEHIAFHLDVPYDALSIWTDIKGEPVAPKQPQRFRLVRQDDNGNRFVMRTTSNQCQADGLADMYERRGHKQAYWCEEITE